jgi:hypothetical protein
MRRINQLLGLLLLSMCGSACSLEDLAMGAGANFTSISVSLAQQNGSGITGTGNGWFNDGDSNASLSFALIGVAVGEQYGGHVHRGSCSENGNLVLTLPVATGRVQTGAGPVAETQSSLPVAYVGPGFSVDFHTAIGGVDRRVACGLILASHT